MERLRKILIVLLGLAMVIGPFVSISQASDMVVKMAVSADMDGAGKSGCDGCSGDSGDAAQCVPVCAVAGFALLPLVSAQDLVPTTELPLPKHLAATGRLFSPDPYPPEPHDL